MIKRIWFNNEYLPTYNEKQKSLWLHLPSIFPLLSVTFQIGFDGRSAANSYYFIIFGFGISYNENWDE